MPSANLRPARALTALLALAILLPACAAPTAQTAAPAQTSTGVGHTSTVETPTTAIPTAAPLPPTAEPSATPEPAIADGVFVAGVDVGGKTGDEARAALEEALAPLLRPLDVRAGDEALLLRPEDIALELGTDEMLEAALAAKGGAKVPLTISYDEAKLRDALGGLSGGEASFEIIKGTQIISRSFALASGGALDVDAAVAQVDERLRSVNGARRITLAAAASARPPAEELQAQLEAMAKEWKGVAGVYVYDLAEGQEIASVNSGSVFAAASTIKVAIMLNAYVNLKTFTKRQELALKKMIEESDNIEANLLLAASINGGGTEDAIKGAERMSDMLAELGLKNTYQYVPYEALEYIRQNKLKYRCGPKDPVGPKPYTETGCALRTAPEEMAQVYVWIEQCSRGEGILLEEFPDTLSAKRCQEMISRLEKNADHKRMVAGLPEDTVVAHKSGWIDIMQADVGIVRSPGGDYIAAIYLYRPLGGDQQPIPDRIMMSSIAGFSRLIYSYYNPLPAKQ